MLNAIDNIENTRGIITDKSISHLEPSETIFSSESISVGIASGSANKHIAKLVTNTKTESMMNLKFFLNVFIQVS